MGVNQTTGWALGLGLGLALAVSACGSESGNGTMQGAQTGEGDGQVAGSGVGDGTPNAGSAGGATGDQNAGVAGTMDSSSSADRGGTGSAMASGDSQSADTAGGGAQDSQPGSDSGAETADNTQTTADMSGDDTMNAGTGGMSGGDEPVVPQGVELVTCEDAKASAGKACGVFITPEGVELQLGPYGAVEEDNLGQGHEVSIAASDTNAFCAGFVSTFGQGADRNEKVLDIEGVDLELFTVFRPANWVEGETYPILTWGNGTCAQPRGYASLLYYVASQGFVVFAANSRQVGSGNNAMIKALDFAFEANDDPDSMFYQRLDTQHVGSFGHSQGSTAAAAAAADPRVKAAVLFNLEPFASKPFLAISGDRDLVSKSSIVNNQSRATKAAWLFYHMIPGTGLTDGHLTLMIQPERLVEPTVGWFDTIFFDDPDAKALFAGANCGLCGHDADFEFGSKGL